MRTIFVLTSLVVLAQGSCSGPVRASEDIPLAAPHVVQPLSASDGGKLRLSTRLEGINLYLPGANHLISIQVPESALQEGWRCCWIEAFSLETARALSEQYRKPVYGNGPDVLLDSMRTESSLRQVAPGRFQGYLALQSPKRIGSHAAKLYVHLYRLDNPDDAAQYRAPFPSRERGLERIARNFLDEPVLTVRFAYSQGHDHAGRNQAPPSQLPNYAPPRY